MRDLPKETIEGFPSNIVNHGYLYNSKKLDDLYSRSKVTLFPSFLNEGFGRVIIESIINKTPVITSPSCGANSYFNDKKFLRILPLEVHLWVNKINDLISKND